MTLFVTSYSCMCLIADLKVIYVHDLLKIVGNSVPNVQIRYIFNDLIMTLWH